MARTVLAADPKAPLSAIAKTADVGQGTLYRHFPTREALVLGVHRKEIDAIVALAPTLLAEHPPLRAFRLWCDRLGKSSRMKHGIADALHAAISGQDIRETYEPMVAAVRRMLDSCEASGDIRPGGDAEDVLTFFGVLWRIPATTAGKVRASKLIAFVLRGLGADDAEPRG